MVKRIISILSLLLNTSVFIALAIITNYILWEFFGKSYIYSEPVGSDYFNALTYLAHFAKYFSHPASSWLPFWNEGNPVIGGYPFLSFYLTIPLLKEYPLTVAMNLFSYGSLLLFFISSLLLFWQVSKNWLVSAGFTLALLTTRATYYQLTTGAFITSASIQWYLPMVLFLLYRFAEKCRLPYLSAASIISGLALLQHGPTSTLMVFLPSTIVLIFLLFRKTLGSHGKNLVPIMTRISYLLFFTLISSLIGSSGLYTLFLQAFLGSGTGACASTQCWGEYPKHLIVWLTPTSAIAALVFLTLASTFKIIKRKINLLLALPAFLGFLFFVAYALAAYLRLIDGLANVIFPTRIFWAVNLLLFLTAASFFASIRRVLSAHSSLIAILTFSTILVVAILKPPQIHKDFNATVPLDIILYTIPQYQTKSPAELVPEWLLAADKNWRVDIFSSGLYHWWNYTSEVPATRGYSNHPLGVHQDWLFFLQAATRDVDPSLDQDLVKNRALFLLDAFGVKFFENSQVVLPTTLVENQQIIAKSQKLRDFEWYELSADITSPIVSPTNTPPILFVGDPKAYESFIRTLAMIGASSKTLIPVKGQESLDKLTKEELAIFPVIFLYQYSGKDFDKLKSYVEEGGHLYVETGSQKSQKEKGLPEIFPAEEFEIKNVNHSAWRLEQNAIKNIDSTKFSALSYKDGPWRITAAIGLKNWAMPVLFFDNQPVIAQGQLGKGFVIWSGFNFPFHIVDHNNFEEAKLFNDLLISLVEPPSGDPVQFKVERQKPEIIEIDAANTNGIYFKENYHSGWKAKVNNKTAKIYKAGLEFMYIPQAQGKITLEFKGNLTTWGLYYLTIISLTAGLIYLILSKPINFIFSLAFQKLRKVWQAKLDKRIKNWIEEE